ncbi:hypothetical protein KKHLCK_02800 [Candidatus Electrothrix laxa]
MTVTELIFGASSLVSLVFAVYTYFKSREMIYPLIEKLRASRNNLLAIEKQAKRIVTIVDLKEKDDAQKIMMARQIARSIEESTSTRMNTIDDGKKWNELNVKEIFSLISK